MTASLWTADAIVAATGGALHGNPFTATGVSIDTRTLEPGDLFVALDGVRDGHDFVGQAFASGAAGVLASRPVDGPAVIVADTLRALEQLGLAARDRSPARRAAVTGSVGKTSVTQAVRAALDLAGPAHGSVKSYNNHIGVPLTLARMPQATERAVFEVGMNHADEITPLSRLVAPQAVAITTVGPVHTENFADGEAGVARAKAEIFAGLQRGGAAVLNADNPWFDLLRAEAAAAGAEVWSFGAGEGCTARLLSMAAGVVEAEVRGERLSFRLLQTGAHWGLNSLCTLLLCEALDVPRETTLAALTAYAPLAGRGAEQVIDAPAGRFTLIDESYNANPISMAATLHTLGQRAAPGHRIAVLTDMLELGPDAPARHAALAAEVERAQVDLVFCAGPLMSHLWEALPSTRRGGYAEDAPSLVSQLTAAVAEGDLVMVKGSNGSRAGLLAQALRGLATTRAGEAG